MIFHMNTPGKTKIARDILITRMRMSTLCLLFSSIYLRTSLDINREPRNDRQKKYTMFNIEMLPLSATVEVAVNEDIATYNILVVATS